jgi:dienelactone hydrolase
MKAYYKQLLASFLLGTTLYAGTIEKQLFVPIFVGDITTFVPTTQLLPDRDNDGIEDALDTPVAYAQTLEVAFNSQGYDIRLQGYDNDNALVYEIVTAPSHGTLSGTAPDLHYVPQEGFEGEDYFTFRVNDGEHTSTTVRVTLQVKVNYGEAGSHEVLTHEEVDTADSIVYYPSDVSQDKKVPLLFFLPGFQSQDHTSYQSLLRFIASRGYAVIYAKDYWADTDKFIERFEKMLDENNEMLPYIDTTRIGVVGHSSGGGDTFRILEHFSNKGYGENGRFVMALDPWFAFEMNSASMRNLPQNSNILIQRYEDEAYPNTQDPRITLSLYALLDSVELAHKDYQVYAPATHSYPAGSKEFEEMQGVLKPLGALMAYTFEEDEDAREVALENGSDTPYEDGLEIMNDIQSYAYRCNSHKNLAEVMEIDYCHQYEGGKVYPQSTVFDDQEIANVAQPEYLESYVDPLFENRVTRITDRENQTANAHNYPKTQSWNANSTLIRLGYRLYNADDFSESILTRDEHLRGSLTEMKWSTFDANVFYGMDVRSDRFVFMKATIDPNEGSISYIDMPNATFMKSDYDELKIGKYEGNLDYQDNYVVFAGRKKDTNRVTLIVYHLHDNYGGTYNRIEANETTEMLWYVEDEEGNFNTDGGSDNQMFDWASVSAKGNYVIVNYRSKKGDDEQEYSIEQYYKNLHHVRRLAEHGNHGDLGVDANGKEVYVQFGFGSLNGESNLGIWMYGLDGSKRVQLLPDKYNGGHISCRNFQRPGWCYVNTRYLDTRDSDHIIGKREAFALKLDETQTVQRFAQTHNSTENAGYTQVNVSPDGTQLLFASDWNNTENVIDTYHVKVGE